jgi:predicted transcriptional regulator
MADVRLDLDCPVELRGDEDEETLAAIDRGIRDADAGRLTPLEEVEKLLPEWISKFSSPTKR